MGQRLTLAVQGKMDVVKINGYDDDNDDLALSQSRMPACCACATFACSFFAYRT